MDQEALSEYQNQILFLIDKIGRLAFLEDSWDSYGADKISPEAIGSTITILLQVLCPGDPIPDVVPLTRGGVQLEWHDGGCDIEIEVKSSQDICCSFDDGFYESCAGMHIDDVKGHIRFMKNRIRNNV